MLFFANLIKMSIFCHFITFALYKKSGAKTKNDLQYSGTLFLKIRSFLADFPDTVIFGYVPPVRAKSPKMT